MFLFQLHKIVYQLLAFLWTTLILYLTLSNNPPKPSWLDNIPHVDKMAHFGLFFIWSVLIFLSFDGKSKSSKIAVSLIAGTLFAILTEWGQAWVPDRQSDFLDFIADSFGIIVGIICTMALKKQE